jgi:hypothetical protein
MKTHVLRSPYRTYLLYNLVFFLLGVCLAQADPVISSQPQSQTVVAGGTATFHVTASGSGSLSYQWWGNLAMLQNGPGVGGTHTSTLTLTNLSTNECGLYYVVVSNAIGAITSAVAPLSVTTPGQPVPACLYGGQSGTLQIASGTGTFAAVSAANKTVTVEPGAALNGAVNLQAVNYGPQEDVAPLIYTPSWGEASNDWQLINYWIDSGPSAQQAQVSVTAPETPGIYYIIFAYQWEVGGDHVASASNWTLDYDVWDDGNDLAQFSLAQLTKAQADGYTVNLWLYPSSASPSVGTLTPAGWYSPEYVPADAVTVVVGTVPPPPARTATATATLVDGFVVAATVTDGGEGYTNTPLVRFIGGGGSGAQAVAVVSNGLVIAVNVMDVGYGYSNAPVVVIEPPFIPEPVLDIAPVSFLAFSNLVHGDVYQLQQSLAWYWTNLPVSFTASNSSYITMVPGIAAGANYRLALSPVPVQAFATPEVVNGFVVGATLTSAGSGYVSSPSVSIVGGGGSSATAVSHVSHGAVTNITITDAGINYTNAPTVQIAPPPANSVSPTVLPGMRLDSTNLAPYHHYQLQYKPGLAAPWEDWIGGLVSVTNAANSQYFLVTNPASFFRLKFEP